MKKDNTYPLQIGPIHPSFKEPVKFLFNVEGEHIISTDIDMGYTHRGIEKSARERTFVQLLYLHERICGICSTSHPMASCFAVEDIAGIEVPPRAKYIRMIVGELERLHSHLLWAGVAAHELGFDTLFFFIWDVREKVLDCLETLTGNRINYGMLMVGGVRRDIPEEQYPVVYEIIDYYKSIYDRLGDIILEDKSVYARCRNVGILTREDAIAGCAVGPTARASGVPIDVRLDSHFGAYSDISWLRPVSPIDIESEIIGDVYDRIIVRVLELIQSIDIINYCIDNMPDGPVAAEDKPVKLLNMLKKVSGEGIGRYEAPRGEVSHYFVLNNSDCPESVKIKAPTYSNAATWTSIMEGISIADIPIVIASIDPCIACTDRMTFVDQKGKAGYYTSKELHRMGIEKMKKVRSSCRR